jgi:hypothetical protein
MKLADLFRSQTDRGLVALQNTLSARLRIGQTISLRRLSPSDDPPPLKWSDLRYVFDIKEDCNGKEAIQA